jgi:predicted nucleotidyltransferase
LRDHILQVLKQLEFEYDVKVLYACESGSRAWGFPSQDSDYDVRFIYIHPKNWYLSIDRGRDVLEIPETDSLSMPVDELLDVSGWELTKALRLFRKSNPGLLEWLRSSIVYYEEFSTVERLRAMELDVFSAKACLFHYLNMAKDNFRGYLHGEEVKIKKYFYMLRPIFAARWIEKYHSVPPIEFQALLEDVVAPGELRDTIDHLLARKIKGDELNIEPRIDVIHQYLEKELNHLEQYAKIVNVDIPDPTEMLDELFREALDEVWE